MKPVDFTIYWEETPVVQVCYDENNKPQFTVLNPSHLPVLLFGMNGNSIIAVKDDGCGFGDVDPKLLFDRFYRTDASRTRGTGGTGLGLAIVKHIAAGIGAQLSLESQVGVGTAITVQFPPLENAAQ